MKKVFLVILFCFLGFVPKGFAFHDLPYSLPATPPGAIETFNNYIQFYDYQGNEYLIYCNNNNDATTYDTNNVVSGYYAPYYISFINVECSTSQYSHYQYNASTNVWYYNLWNSGSVYLDHAQPLADSVRTTVNLKNLSGTLTLPGDFAAYGWSGSTAVSQNQILVSAGNNITYSLNVSRSPEAGGGIASLPDGVNLDCNAESSIRCGECNANYCTKSFNANSNVVLKGFPGTGYAFAYWEWNEGGSSSTNNPETFTMSSALEVTGVFKPQFTFPLDGYTPTTVPISAVVDNSVFDTTPIQFYPSTRDNIVRAFTNEVAEYQYGYMNSNGVWGYKKDGGGDFLNGYNYTAPKDYLFYDGHSGFDFAVSAGTDVLAPANGKLYWATTDPVNGSPSTFGTFYVDHENGYTTWFLHCSGLTQDVAAEVQQNGYAEVTRGEHIAETGDKGASSHYHLHFEVRKGGIDDENIVDPYKEGLWE